MGEAEAFISCNFTVSACSGRLLEVRFNGLRLRFPWRRPQYYWYSYVRWPIPQDGASCCNTRVDYGTGMCSWLYRHEILTPRVTPWKCPTVILGLRRSFGNPCSDRSECAKRCQHLTIVKHKVRQNVHIVSSEIFFADMPILLRVRVTSCRRSSLPSTTRGMRPQHIHCLSLMTCAIYVRTSFKRVDLGIEGS